METLEAQWHSAAIISEASEAPGPRTGQVDFRVMLTFLEFYRAMVKLHPQYFAFVWLKFPSGFLRMIVLVHPCNNVYAPEGSRTTAPMKTQTEGHHLAVPVNRLVLNVSRQGL